MTGLRAAIGFLTCLPGASHAPGLARAAPWFPVVGLLVGALAAGVRALAGLALPSAPATVLALLAAVLVTRGLHEDGLADVADAVGAHTTPARRQEILHDPRVGTFGALALVFAVVLPLVALAPLRAGEFLRVSFAAHVLGRCAPVAVAAVLDAQRLAGSAAALRELPARGTGAGLLAGVAIAVAATGWLPGLAAVAAIAVTTAATVAICLRSLGGVNGDVLGATVKLAEVACVLAATAARGG